MSYAIKKTRCPSCALIGQDRSGDNLVVYSDGGCHCFSCGYHRSPNNVTRFKSNHDVPRSSLVHLPSDVTTDLPLVAKSWLQSLGYTQTEIIKYRLMWSEYMQRLIFPFFSDTGLTAWQGRYLGSVTGKPKWFSQGKIHDILTGFNLSSRKAILVENIVSAHKIARLGLGAIPLYGSKTNIKHLLRLSKHVDEVWVWLDPDKRSEALKIDLEAKLIGLQSHIIFTDKKPHKYSTQELQEIL